MHSADDFAAVFPNRKDHRRIGAKHREDRRDGRLKAATMSPALATGAILAFATSFSRLFKNNSTARLYGWKEGLY